MKNIKKGLTKTGKAQRIALPCLALPCLALPCLALPCSSKYVFVCDGKT